MNATCELNPVYCTAMHLFTRAYACAPLLLMLATLGWAGNTTAGKLLAEDTSPMMVIFLRWGMVALVLGAVARRGIAESLPAARGRRGWLLFMGAAITLFNGLFYWAANFTTAINLGIVQSTIPAFILLGGYLFFAEGINKRQFVAMCATLVGSIVVVSRGDVGVLLALTLNPGDVLMMTACIFYATYTLGLRRRPQMGAFVMMWFIAVASWVATIPLVLLEAALGYTRMPGWQGWLVLGYVALVPSFLSQVFFIRGVDLIGTARAGLYANLVPVFAALLGVILLGETPYAYHAIALLLVFAGIYLFEKSKGVT